MHGEIVDTVIIAKSVLATGCTAISLTRKALEKYTPQAVIIAAVFYSVDGINAILQEISTAKLFVFGDPDQLQQDGLLVPGFGDLDKRLAFG